MRLLPPTLVLILLAAMVALSLLAPGPTLLPYPYNLGGILPAGLGFVLATVGRRHFARAGTNIVTFDEPGVLVTDGLFRWTRNPMYLGMLLFLFGTGVLLGATTPFAAVALFAIAADRWYIAFEERALAAKFGAAYAAYAGRTRRWL